MFKRNHIYTALVATSAVFVSSAAVAQETVTGDATVTVSNAFTLQQDVAIDFGTLRVFNDTSSGSAGLVTVNIPGNTNPMTLTASTPAEADGSIIAAGAPGEFSVSGAATFTPLTIEFPSGPVELSNSAAPPATPVFNVAFSDSRTFIVGGANDGIAYSSGNLTTDATGAVGFRLGGLLSTVSTATASYADGAYSGSFTLTVRY